MFLVWKRKQRKKSVRRGYFFCPSCRCRRPGEMFTMIERESLFGIFALPFLFSGQTGESGNYLRCDTCENDFSEDDGWPYDFGDHATPKVWDCRQCGEINSNERFNCQRCGRRI